MLCTTPLKRLIVLSFVVTGVCLLHVSAALQAAEQVCEKTPAVIALKEDISPDSVTVKLGNTIIWHNKGPGPVTIKFITRIGLACAAPINFYADLLGNYETTPIPEGGTASICLIEEGRYEYEVRRLVAKGTEPPVEMIAKGTVISAK